MSFCLERIKTQGENYSGKRVCGRPARYNFNNSRQRCSQHGGPVFDYEDVKEMSYKEIVEMIEKTRNYEKEEME